RVEWLEVTLSIGSGCGGPGAQTCRWLQQAVLTSAATNGRFKTLCSCGYSECTAGECGESTTECLRLIALFRLRNPGMNKRARKRLKEAIEKKNLERQKMLKEQSSASSQTKERRGFTVKPEKKRG